MLKFSRRRLLIFIAIGVISLAVLIPAGIYINNRRDVSPIVVKKTYENLSEAMLDYFKYPTERKYIPVNPKGYSGNYYSPFEKSQKLQLDISEGGGYKCCGQPTYYAWVDVKNNIAWIRYYQASLFDIDERWFGPFKINTLKTGHEKCASLKSETKDTCYFLEATQGKNPDYCNIINSNNQRDDCYSKLSFDLSRLDLCDEISQIKDRGYCQRMLAQYKLKDSKVCEMIEDKWEKENCVKYTR
mgnify:CR=1 FL=1